MTPDYVVYVDGGGTGNPGRLAVAAVVCTPAPLCEVVAEWACWAGEGTTNVAEYRALRHGIFLARLVGAQRPMFVSDSMLVVQQVNRWWAMSGGGELHSLHGYCSSALMEFDRWWVKHVGREHNKRADWLVCGLIGHSRTLKNQPQIVPVEADTDGRGGWAHLEHEARR